MAKPAGYYQRQREDDPEFQKNRRLSLAVSNRELELKARELHLPEKTIAGAGVDERHRGLGVVDAKGPDSTIRQSPRNMPASGTLGKTWGADGGFASGSLRQRFGGGDLTGPGADGMGGSVDPAWRTRARNLKQERSLTGDMVNWDAPGAAETPQDFSPTPAQPILGPDPLSTDEGRMQFTDAMRRGFGNSSLMSAGANAFSALSTSLMSAGANAFSTLSTEASLDHAAVDPVDLGGLFGKRGAWMPDTGKKKDLSLWHL